MEKIGIIAGNRKFPLIFCEAAKKKKYSIVAIAVKHDTLPQLKKHVDKIYWLGLNEFSRMFEIFKSEGVAKVVMAGQISPGRLFGKEIEQDPQLKELFAGIKDKRAETIFKEIAERLQKLGIEVMDSTIFLKDFLPKRGVLTKRSPTFEEWEDLYFGFDLAKEIAYLDVGQTVAVKQKAVVAVEALEGTDNLILRAGRIAKAGFAVVKVSRPNQDMRFDIPVVGLHTITTLARAGAACLAIEADKTLFIDEAPSITLAERHDIAIVAV